MSGNQTVFGGLNRRGFLAAGGGALGAIALATSTWAAGPPTTGGGSRTRKPNIVIVLADDLGWGELGSYGQQLIETPVLDRLADEGVRYTDFYSGAPVCAPSRCTLLTGLHAGHSTVRNNPSPGEPDGQLRSDEVTFATLLKSMGYRTGLFGKWGFSDDTADTSSHPNDHGFDEFFGFLTHIHAHQYYPSHLWQNRQRVSVPANTFAPDLFSQRSLDFIDASAEDPFLLFVSTQLPHAPQHIPSQGQYGGRGWGAGEANHAAQVSYLDDEVGRIVDKLEERGIADDTVLIFMSDNGPHEENGSGGSIPFNPDFFDANGPLRGYKRNLHDGGIRVPAIVWAPGMIREKAGTTVSQPLAMWDILPTLADLAGAPLPPLVDGASVRHTFDATAPARSRYPKPPQNRSLYWWRVEPYASPKANAAEGGGPVTRAAEAVRQGDWKALRFAPAQNRNIPDSSWDFRLHNLATDLGENTNVAAQNPTVAAALLAAMKNSWVEPGAERPQWSPWPLVMQGPSGLAVGRTATVGVVLTNHRTDVMTRVDVDLQVPTGWRVSSPRRDRLGIRPGQARRFEFEVTVPAGAALGQFELSATATFRERARQVTETASRQVQVVAASQTSYLSDLEWVSATNGWGPVEKDATNGTDQAGGDGPISLGGVEYAKGLGVHAPSRIIYALGGLYSRFTATVGVDDFSVARGTNGSVVFQVWGDGTLLHDTGLRTGASQPVELDVNIAGVDRLELVVTDGGNDNQHDHASWASAMVHAS